MPKKKPRKQSRARAREEDDSIGGMISNATRQLKKIWNDPVVALIGSIVLSGLMESVGSNIAKAISRARETARTRREEDKHRRLLASSEVYRAGAMGEVPGVEST